MNLKYKNLIKDTIIFALGSVGSKFILFFLVPLYTNCLSQAEYGTADLVFTIAQVFIPIVSLVIFDSVIRFGLENRKSPENVFLIAVIIWGVGCIISLVIVPIVGVFDAVKAWKWYLYFYMIFNILLSIVLNYLKVKNNNLLYSCICIVQTFSLAILNIYLLLIKHTGVCGYLISNIVACIIAIIIAVILGNLVHDLRKSKYDFKLAKRMVLYSFPLIFNNLAWWIIQSSDKVMIQIMLGEGVLGLYTVATRIPSLINVVVSVFQQSWGISAIVEMDSDNDKKFYSDVFGIFTAGVFIACIMINACVKYFMKIYVSKDFYEAWKFVPLLVCSASFSAIAAYFGAIYGALKKSVNNMISTVASGVLNIIINLIFIPLIGGEGAVIGTLVAYFFLAYVRLKDCLRFVDIDVNIVKLFINSLLIVVHGIFVSANIHVILISIIIIICFICFNKEILGKYLSCVLKVKNRKGV